LAVSRSRVLRSQTGKRAFHLTVENRAGDRLYRIGVKNQSDQPR